MIRNYFILAMLLLSTVSMAQTDRVYLKNGSLLKGEILQIDAKQLSIDIGEAEPLSLSLGHLRAVKVKKKRTALAPEVLHTLDSLNRALKSNLWLHQVRVGIINGEDGGSFISSTGFSTDYTLFFTPKATWHIGLGFGYDEYPSFQVLPVGIELRKDWGIGPAPFFTYFRTGISRAGHRGGFIGFNSSVRGHEFFAFGVGQQWSLGRTSMFISTGFRSQSLSTSWSNGDFRSRTDWNLNRLDIKVGMVF